MNSNLILLAAACLTQSVAIAQTPLTIQWPADKTVTYVIQDRNETQRVTKYGTFDLQQSLTLDTRWTANGKDDDDNQQLLVVIDRARFTADGKGAAAMVRNMQLDTSASTQPRTQPAKTIATLLVSCIGAEIQVKFNQQNEVVQLVLPKQIIDQPDKIALQEIAGFFGGSFRPDGLQNLLTDWITVAPAEVPQDKLTWTQEQASQFGAKFVWNRTYHFVGSEDSAEATTNKIEFTAELAEPGAGNDGKQTEKPIIVTQSGSGSILFDSPNSLIQKMTIVSDVTMETIGKSHFVESYSATLQ